GCRLLAPASKEAGHLGAEKLEITDSLRKPRPSGRARAQCVDTVPEIGCPPDELPVAKPDDLIPDVGGHLVVLAPRAGLTRGGDQADLDQVPDTAGHRRRARLEQIGELSRGQAAGVRGQQGHEDARWGAREASLSELPGEALDEVAYRSRIAL